MNSCFGSVNGGGCRPHLLQPDHIIDLPLSLTGGAESSEWLVQLAPLWDSHQVALGSETAGTGSTGREITGISADELYLGRLDGRLAHGFGRMLTFVFLEDGWVIFVFDYFIFREQKDRIPMREGAHTSFEGQG